MLRARATRPSTHKAGADSGQLKISAKPDQSQQYAKIDFPD
jgi:hypothetical protein